MHIRMRGWQLRRAAVGLGQFEEERGAAGSGLERDVAAEPLDDGATDGKPQAGASAAA
jgi:hypothetical protein